MTDRTGAREAGFREAGFREAGSGIIGRDDRTAVEDTTAFPYAATGQLNIDFAETTVTGTGVLVSDTHVLTAAQLFFDGDQRRDLEEATFTPGRAGATEPFGSAFVADVHTLPEFGSFAEDFAYDLAILELDRPLGAETGAVEAFSTDGLPLAGAELTLAGFADDFGTQMFRARDEVQRVEDNILFHYIDVAPGSSGAPIFGAADGRVGLAGLNIAADSADDMPNFALRMNDDFVARIQTATDHGLDILRDFGVAAYRADPALEFDEAFYLDANPDVAAAVEAGAFASGFAHYDAFGRAELRSPTDWFDPELYLQSNPDVAAADIDPFVHFLSFGQFEGRASTGDSPLPYALGDFPERVDEAFQATFYLEDNPDVAAAVDAGRIETAFTHYVLFGRDEGRNPTEWFDTANYLDANPDVAAAGADPFEHFLRYGQFEDRKLHPGIPEAAGTTDAPPLVGLAADFAGDDPAMPG